MNDSEKGYVNYFEILGLDENARPGDVRKVYRRLMRDLVYEIHNAEITEERRAHYLLEMAKLNAALYILRENDTRDAYWNERKEVMELERRWREAAEQGSPEADQLRRQFDGRIRHFLSHYVEEAMLDAGRDKECVEASHWDAAHERHASRILRHYRHGLYQDILERLPYHEVTKPEIDWEERRKTVAQLVAGGR
jgi:DnaJ-class molecular chaperone